MNETKTETGMTSESEREAFLLSVDETEREYETSLKKGLTSAQVQEKTARYGKNMLRETKRKTIVQMFIAQFSDVLILVLLAAAVVSGFLGEVSDTLLIIVIVIINAVIGVVQERKAEDSMEALKKMVVPEAKVMRDGQQMIVQSVDLVPGDVVYLDAGDTQLTAALPLSRIAPPAFGAEIKVVVDPADVMLFDAASGARLDDGAN